MHIQTTSVREKKKNISVKSKRKMSKATTKDQNIKTKQTCNNNKKKKQVNSLEDVSPYTESEMDSSSASYPKKRMASKE